MASEWKSLPIADAPIDIIDGDRGTNYPKQADFSPSGHCLFLNTGNVTTSGFNFSERSFVSVEKDEELRKGKLQRHDVVLTTRGTVGNTALFDDSVPFEHLRINSGMVLLRADRTKIFPNFLYQFVRSESFRNQVAALTTGSAQPQLPIRDIRRVQIPLPPLPEQKAIARILGTLDDKIELNRRMNATLEAMARALFQSWFVDFDPVHAKAAGHPPAGLDDKTSALFSASFQDSNLGEIPLEWSYLEAQEIAQIGIGKTPPRKEPQWFSESPNDIPWVSIKDMGASGVFAQQTSEFLTEDAVTRFSVRRVPKNTVLLSFKLTVGRVVIADMPLTTNEAIAHFGLSAEQGITPEFLYLYLSQFDYDSLGSTSSIATAVNSATIRMMPVLVPPRKLVSKFTAIVSPLFERIRINQSESVTLEATRDVLLPQLLNGKINPLRAD